MIVLLPAAGRATRLPALQGRSKECLGIAPNRAAADCLLDAAARAEANHALWLIRAGKADIRAHYGDAFDEMPLRYHQVPDTPSTLHTLRHALDDDALGLDRETVALGFPDIQFRQPDALQRLEAELLGRGADVVLGCFHTDRPDKVDTIETDPQGNVHGLHIKSDASPSRTAWVLAVWSARFTRYLCDRPVPPPADTRNEERYIGHELQAALRDGFCIRALHFDSPLLDLGTPEDLVRASAFWEGH